MRVRFEAEPALLFGVAWLPADPPLFRAELTLWFGPAIIRVQGQKVNDDS